MAASRDRAARDWGSLPGSGNRRCRIFDWLPTWSRAGHVETSRILQFARDVPLWLRQYHNLAASTRIRLFAPKRGARHRTIRLDVCVVVRRGLGIGASWTSEEDSSGTFVPVLRRPERPEQRDDRSRCPHRGLTPEDHPWGGAGIAPTAEHTSP
jgi:hypothetical protein